MPAALAPRASHPARYAVGIDLGTSHTVAAYAPLAGGADGIALLPIPQRASAGEVVAQPLLASARYQAAPGELGAAWMLPWAAQGADERAPAVVGRWARDLGAVVPGRLVASAKSWLSHAGVDRTAPILPWGAPEGEGGVAKVSPLQASASYLAHVRAAWDAAHPLDALAGQRLVLTVPASFDEGARALTLEAARLAGLPQVHLLEEPKAAFHDWLALQGERLAEQLAGSRLVLVADVGGGTTDFTLIRVNAADDGGWPTLTRTAVGEHLMLGGDNMDLALAHRLEPHFAPAGERLTAARFAQLVQRCRLAKERLLAADAPESLDVTLLGAGSQLLARTQSAVLTRAAVREWVVEGFMPEAAPQDRPARRLGALRGLGLPYPADAAITRHLAQFLGLHAGDGLPDTVLLNGGVFHAPDLAGRLTGTLARWRGAPVRVLHNPHPDWAVARGAAVHGLARFSPPPSASAAAPAGRLADGGAMEAEAADPAPASVPPPFMPHIAGGAARGYWLVLPDSKRHKGNEGRKGREGDAPQGICLLPRGTQEGVPVVLEGRRFALRLGQAVRFDLVASSRGQALDAPGRIAPLDGDGWVALPPLSAVLPAPEGGGAARAEVCLQACMTEVGTLEVRCVSVRDAGQQWLLPFAVRGVSAPDVAALPAPDAGAVGPAGVAGAADVFGPSGATGGPEAAGGVGAAGRPLAEGRLPEAVALIERVFGHQAQGVEAKEVRQLRQSLEKTLGPREGWPVGLLRALFDALLARARRRRRSPGHERAWLNLAGWCLRPGVGAALDDWRIEQVWALYEQGLAHTQDSANWTEWWVFWRRVAAGLAEDRQMTVLEAVAGCMQKTVQQAGRRGGGQAEAQGQKGEKGQKGPQSQQGRHGGYDDMLRLFAAMEAVPWSYRQEMGRWMLDRLRRPGESVQTWWALGRLAARQPLAANAHRVMPPEAAAEFLQAAMAQDWRGNEVAMYAAVQMARLTGDRARDLPEDLRQQVLERLRQARAPERWIAQVETLQALDAADQQRSFGDSLPPGLALI